VADREDEGTAPQEEEPQRAPLDEDAAWAALVAGFDEEPEPGTADWPEAENVPEDGAAEPSGPDPTDPAAVRTAPPPAERSIVIHPVIRGPRDYELADDEDDAHYEPPEPPPLPEADVTTKFAWLAVLGGPLLLIVLVLLQMDITWWQATLGVGGFLGGFATLVSRMRTAEDDEEDDDPDRGARV
jgi:hypothetical protein